jgi:hypothetical protein
MLYQYLLCRCYQKWQRRLHHHHRLMSRLVDFLLHRYFLGSVLLMVYYQNHRQ